MYFLIAMASEQRSLPTTSASTPAANSLASNRFAENGKWDSQHKIRLLPKYIEQSSHMIP